MSSKNYDEDDKSQLVAIGKEVKLAFPGQFNDATDFAVGELSVLKGLWPLRSSPKEKPLFFPELRRRYRQKQVDYAIDAATENWRIEQAIRNAELSAAMNPRRIAQQIFLEEQTFQNAAKTNQLTNQLLEQASVRQVDIATYNAIRLEEERARLLMETKRQDVLLEIHKHRELQRMDLEKQLAEGQMEIDLLERAANVKQRLLEARQNNIGPKPGRTTEGEADS